MERQHITTTNSMVQGEKGTNISIHGGHFTQHNQPPPVAVHKCYDAKDGFSHLQAHVATTAFDSAQQGDAPKCHPNTRQAVQDDIMNWILPTVMRIQWMLWLNGAAGAGKSAIARSIVALCLARNIPIARFFFFRTDTTRNDIQPVIATLVHQLIQQIPDLLEIVIPKIQSDPLIFTKSLKTQLQYLVFDPLRQLHRNSPLRVVVLLFDGIDECSGHNNQTDLVRLISNFLSTRDLPIIAFFSSRTENQLQQVFHSHEISTNLHQLALDNHYLPDADIRIFLDDKFKHIKETHPFKRHLAANWPDPAHVEEIIDKSSGQFIYASVVINFVSSSRNHPAQQLDIIRGLRPAGNSTPFAQLDALYKHIFSEVQNIDHVFLILAWAMFETSGYSPRLYEFSGMKDDDLCVLLADLTSIIVYENGNIAFLHASLPDFLLDRTRSQDYYLDKKFWCTQLSIHYFCLISNGMDYAFHSLVDHFLPSAELTAELREHVHTFNYDVLQGIDYSLIIDYVTAIEMLDCGADRELYYSQLDRATRYTLEHRMDDSEEPKPISKLQEYHNISAILAQIKSEKAVKLALRQPNDSGPDSEVRGVLHIFRRIFKRGESVVGSVADNEAVAVKRAEIRGGKIKVILRRIFKFGRKKNAAVSSNRPAAEAAASPRDRTLPK
ncbi:hypothetical protein HYPSUDRAFT_43257 [Hypholoma sublateritium FD-334 SS-4]|uniref:NACHT domain-containing protein n=1 Tax=Hypholoma sublateritium (strain FD-334 SS-4) TaxID=945553 RepID=A0A0D2NUY2_HYPSF|nr:hypothetical protein HYPSUDRAFT_43257 [Hypholoma sublateritium FD-334 SS-4]